MVFGLGGIDLKAPLRALGENRRATAKTKHPTAGAHAAAHLMRALAPAPDQIVAVYHCVGNEIDTWPLVEALRFNGNQICLPVVVGKNEDLIFRLFDHETPLCDGILGIKTPPQTAPVLTPDIVVCPLVAWKRDGTRLGMGGGYYDRTLMKLRNTKTVTAIGYGYALQEIAALSPEDHDQPMDWIITEQKAFKV